MRPSSHSPVPCLSVRRSHCFASGLYRDPGRLGGRELARGEDERQVAEGLGEVADLASTRDVVLLGEQAEVVGEAGKPLEKLACLLDAAVARERVDEPERAGQE